jgi:hypothetical protein
MSTLRAHLGWLSLVAASLVSSVAGATPPEAAIVTRARELGIARSREWRRLIHDRRGAWGGVASGVDGQEFFLAADGKHDPEAELEATLDAFLRPVVAGNEDAHALCRFPARRRLLDEQLHFDPAMHAPSCPALSRFVAALDAEAVAIVYSANYLNNPASAFGHTFLRIEKRRSPGAAQSPEERDFGIDFIATTDTNNPLLYAFKGLTGLFPGRFQFNSFATKVREYGNLEARDLWEYDLALTPGEVQLLALHLWELAATHIDYYYLTHNCSYEILAAVEAAVPRIDLVSHLKFVVLPKDAIRALLTVPGLVRGVEYRPSLRSRFRAQVSHLSAREKDTVERLTRDPWAPIPGALSLAETVTALDTAVFVVDARLAKPPNDPNLVTLRARLIARRELVSPSQPAPTPLPAPADKAPDRGPGAMRFTLGSGATTQYGAGFATLGYRLALHDLADPPDGEPELSQLQFLDTRLRYDLGRRLLTLDRLTFAEIVALNPITRYEKALSWRAEAFGMRLHDRACPDCFAHGVDFALGGTVATEDEHVALFAMGEAYVAFSGSLDGIAGSFVRVGAGPYAGLRVRLADETVALITASWSYLPDQNLHSTYDVRANLRRPLGKNVALGIEAAMQPLSREAQLASYLYF